MISPRAKNFIGEMATTAARMRYDDLAARCRSSRGDPFGISYGPLGGSTQNSGD